MSRSEQVKIYQIKKNISGDENMLIFRLHETMIELHDQMIMEMQILAKENSSLKKTNGVIKEESR